MSILRFTHKMPPPTREEIAELEVPIPDDFRGLNEYEPIHVYTRNLPHWRQDGATYFVTFRQADSIPQGVWEEMADEAEYWQRCVETATRGGTHDLPEKLKEKFEQFLKRYGNRLESELDACHGSCLLRKPELRKIVAESLPFFNGKRYDLYAAVVMPNHCHVAVRPYPGWALEDICQAWKGFTSLEIHKRLGTEGTFWQAESYDRIIRDGEHFQRVVRYILRNPGKAGLRDGEYRMHCGERVWGD